MGQVLPGKRQREEDDSPESLPGPKKLCKEQDGSAVAQGCVRPVATPQNLETSAPPTQPSEDWTILGSIEAVMSKERHQGNLALLRLRLRQPQRRPSKSGVRSLWARRGPAGA